MNILPIEIMYLDVNNKQQGPYKFGKSKIFNKFLDAFKKIEISELNRTQGPFHGYHKDNKTWSRLTYHYPCVIKELKFSINSEPFKSFTAPCYDIDPGQFLDLSVIDEVDRPKYIRKWESDFDTSQKKKSLDEKKSNEQKLSNIKSQIEGEKGYIASLERTIKNMKKIEDKGGHSLEDGIIKFSGMRDRAMKRLKIYEDNLNKYLAGDNKPKRIEIVRCCNEDLRIRPEDTIEAIMIFFDGSEYKQKNKVINIK